MAEYKSIYTGEQIDAGIGKAYTSLQQETDPIFSESPSASITSQDISNWNAKSDFSGSYNDLTNKPEIPSATSDLTNDSGFITKTVNDLVNYYLKSEVYTKEEVAQLIGSIQQFHYEVVQELPQTGANNIMYLVPKSTSQTNNVYDEYVYSNGWEKIGDTEIDLSNYVTKTDYATNEFGGVIRTSNNNAFQVNNTGLPYSDVKTYEQYISAVNLMFISKGTLENVLNERFSAYTTTANLTTLLAGKQDVIDSTHKLDADLVDDTNSTNKFFSGNYNDLTNKPTIPIVPTNVSAFTNDAGYLTSHQDITGKEDKTNKVTSLSSSSTDTQYPSAKCIYDLIGNINTILATLTTPSGNGGNE